MTTWNFDFPTQVEGYIWKVSCVVILVGSLPAPVWFGFADHFLSTGYTGWYRAPGGECLQTYLLERFGAFLSI
ncbi:hypothetical protein BDD12DRAFT_276016 [Trichophaea hybrida]|nr:hypothetical protein BDD12DRAFT_276016 [Trichophaea hybrida]